MRHLLAALALAWPLSPAIAQELAAALGQAASNQRPTSGLLPAVTFAEPAKRSGSTRQLLNSSGGGGDRTDNQFQASASERDSEQEQERAREGKEPGQLEGARRLSRAAQAPQQADAAPLVRALASQRLVIPCKNLSAAPWEPASSSGGGGGAAINQAALSLAAQSSAAAASGRRQASPRFKSPTIGAPLSAGPAAGPGGGAISLIVWHKDGQLSAPIFAADARGASSLRDSKQQVSLESLRGRAHLDLVALGPELARGTPASAPALIIDEAQLQDAGLYTCVVEFLRAPTQTYKVRVSVVEPPRNMIIRDESALEGSRTLPASRVYAAASFPSGTSVGPHDEDSRLALVCEVESGRPAGGQVSWWQLDSVTQLANGPAPSQQHKHSAQAPTMRQSNHAHLLDAADLLTTLSLDPDPLSSLAPDELEATANRAARDLYLGPRSLRHAVPGAEHLLASDSAGQQEALAPLVSRLMSSLNLSSSLRSTARLRHWRRVSPAGASNASQHQQPPPATDESEPGPFTPTLGPDPASPPTPLSARLELARLSRAHLGAEFLCLATNDYLTAPLNASVTLNLNLHPTEVRIVQSRAPALQGSQGNRTTLSQGVKTMLECHAVGSKPSPSIRWFRGSQEIELHTTGDDRQQQQQQQQQPPPPPPQQSDKLTASEFNRDTGNLTKISYLTFVPQLSDNQQTLTCSASNVRMSSARTLADSLVMDVQFAPRLKLTLGANIRADSLRLGADIFMDCHIEANPAVQELVWLHQGRPLGANISAGIIMSKQTLVLRNISLYQRGAYQCQARNSVGRATSDKLELRPHFEPQCDLTLTRARHEVALNQATRIECHVLAEPAEGLHFTWRFNRSGSSLESGPGNFMLAPAQFLGPPLLPPSPPPPLPLEGSSGGESEGQREAGGNGDSALSQYETNFTRSSVIFTPRSRRHFGQLLCSAANSVGRQLKPCVIQLVPSELPEPVLLCFDDNIKPRSFSIHCTPPATSSSSLSASSSSFSSSGAYSSSGSGGPGPNRYVLEVYASSGATGLTYTPEQNDDDENSPDRQRDQQDQPSGAGGATHPLRLRGDQPPPPPVAGRATPNSDAELTSAGDYFAPAGDDTELQADRPSELAAAAATRRQVRIKRLLSESPTFEVADLRPNSSYNILVYVQNSRGRSSAFHHQVSTQPEAPGGDDGAAQAAASTTVHGGSGGIELGGARAVRVHATQEGVVARMLGYLNMSGHGAGVQRAGAASPLAGVALVVLLASVSIVALVFFVNRLVCARRSAAGPAGSSSGRSGSSRSAAKRAPKVSSSDEDDAARGQMARAQARPQLASGDWSTGSSSDKTSGRQKSGCGAGTGSGSDTSRDTNTDSTALVSSPGGGGGGGGGGPNELCAAGELSVNKTSALLRAQREPHCAQHQDQAVSSFTGGYTRRCSQGDLARLAVDHLPAAGSATMARPAPTAGLQCGRASTLVRQSSQQRQSQAQGQQQQQQQQQQPLLDINCHSSQQQVSYDPAAHYQAVASARQLAPSCTPQMSAHSSECSTSNNVDSSLDLMAAAARYQQRRQQQLQQQQQQQLQQDEQEGGVYVLDDGGVGAAVGHFWYDQLAHERHPNGRDFGHPSAASSARCQLLGDNSSSPGLSLAGGQHQQHPHQLSSSFSIPVSLSDRLSLIAGPQRPGSALQQQHHQQQQQHAQHAMRLSQDNLTAWHTGAGCGAACTSPYLTLAGPDSITGGSFMGPAHDNLCPAATVARGRRHWQLQDDKEMPSPPLDFAGRGAGDTCWLSAAAHPSGCANAASPAAASSRPPKHRVKFDTPSTDFGPAEQRASSGSAACESPRATDTLRDM